MLRHVPCSLGSHLRYVMAMTQSLACSMSMDDASSSISPLSAGAGSQLQPVPASLSLDRAEESYELRGEGRLGRSWRRDTKPRAVDQRKRPTVSARMDRACVRWPVSAPNTHNVSVLRVARGRRLSAAFPVLLLL